MLVSFACLGGVPTGDGDDGNCDDDDAVVFSRLSLGGTRRFTPNLHQLREKIILTTRHQSNLAQLFFN